ncbi:MAG: hypothetical protein EKK39_00600 [Sphingobacteriales bacterium]|uniref:hypothetical protein n=1 Tax=Hydrotalea flava TaxID=714549 RepID=UPI00083124EB|nr:hypothetical protein [Hydrotalea flava]RTL56607.1 MAG: hypothetical protein EKK39_00600 [Sphingobacteriales bacterium]
MAASTDTISAHMLIHLLAQQQVQSAKFFTTGTFPSYRTYRYNTSKPDDNIFFTGLIVFTLKQLYPLADSADKILIDSIIERAKSAFKKFKNKKGRNTYNFWATHPSVVFPNGGWLNLMNRSMALPDDMDDTVIDLLALGTDSISASAVHLLMQQYTNHLNGKIIRNTKKPLKKLRAYSTWFGKKMPIDFDVCVLANILYFVQAYHLPFTKADSASVGLLKISIEKKYILNSSAIISPHYQRTPVILYHLARLMSLSGFDLLDESKPVLMQTAHQILSNSSTNYFDKIIVATALLRWSENINSPLKMGVPQIQNFFKNNQFVFFKANMGSILPNPFKMIFEKLNIGQFNYYSPAYNIVLLLEYLLLQQQYNQAHP